MSTYDRETALALRRRVQELLQAAAQHTEETQFLLARTYLQCATVYVEALIEIQQAERKARNARR